MSKHSVYERINAAIGGDGRLPHDFSLEEPKAPNQLSIMPGMIDGTGVFGHYDPGDAEKEAARIVRLLKQYLRNGKKKYLDEIEEITTKTGALSVVDLILEGVRDKHSDIDPQKLFEFSVELATTSCDSDLVKLGISFLGLFDLGTDESVLGIVTTLALYDEYTLFAAVAASRWTGGNAVVFQIAKRVDGWGKIQAVKCLEPENEEIREWILREGCANRVMDEYLGLTCAEKGDLITALRKDDMDDELFDSVSIIINALLDENPAPGISEYDHAEEALSRYLLHAKNKADKPKHLWHILNVCDFAEDSELLNKDDVITQCTALTSNPEWERRIKNAVEQRNDKDFFYVCNAAARLDIDISSLLLAAVKENPIEYGTYAPRLMADQNVACEIINLYESELPLDEMATGMGDYFFADKLRKEHGCLDYILPALAQYPLQGIKLIRAGLNSPVVRERNMACKALSGWVKEQGLPLADISPDAFSEIERIINTEINEQTKETMQKLLDGSAADDDDYDDE